MQQLKRGGVGGIYKGKGKIIYQNTCIYCCLFERSVLIVSDMAQKGTFLPQI